MPKKHADCDACGEHEKLHVVTVHIDGRRQGRWQLCKACTALKRVVIGVHKAPW